MARTETPRGNKRDIQKRVERYFDRAFFDYPTRVQPQRPKAILLGIAVASVLYGLTFAGMQFGYANNFLDSNTYFKLSWITMVPTTVLGLLTWQIAKNRLEYPLRAGIRGRMNEIESNGGVLWRFQPVFDAYAADDMAAKKVLAASQRGETAKVDIDDYAATVIKLFKLLEDTPKIPATLVQEVERCFS